MTDVLCRLDDIPDPGCRGPFIIDGQKIFLYRKGARVWAWVDSCPHARAPLEMEPDRFLDITGEYLLCSLHGAHFDPQTGECVLGPCRGRGLSTYPVFIHNGKVVRSHSTDGL
jgi:nitrite reductase/ring-hydroxylating ferredoxin subunit